MDLLPSKATKYPLLTFKQLCWLVLARLAILLSNIFWVSATVSSVTMYRLLSFTAYIFSPCLVFDPSKEKQSLGNSEYSQTDQPSLALRITSVTTEAGIQYA